MSCLRMRRAQFASQVSLFTISMRSASHTSFPKAGILRTEACATIPGASTHVRIARICLKGLLWTYSDIPTGSTERYLEQLLID
jgi:hypothetical protein